MTSATHFISVSQGVSFCAKMDIHQLEFHIRSYYFQTTSRPLSSSCRNTKEMSGFADRESPARQETLVLTAKQ